MAKTKTEPDNQLATFQEGLTAIDTKLIDFGAAVADYAERTTANEDHAGALRAAKRDVDKARTSLGAVRMMLYAAAGAEAAGGVDEQTKLEKAK